MPPPWALCDSVFLSLRSLQGVRRSSFHSFYRKGLEAVGFTPDDSFPKKLASLLPRNWWPWVWSYVRHVFQAKHEFPGDRKSTRLNSSHSQISYAVFCLKKKNLALFATLSPNLRLDHVHPDDDDLRIFLDVRPMLL